MQRKFRFPGIIAGGWQQGAEAGNARVARSLLQEFTPVDFAD